MYLFRQYKGFIPKVNEKLHLSKEHIEDAYSDALVKLIRTIKEGTFKGESKLSSYFYRIFYNSSVDVSRKASSNKNMATVELLEYNAKEKDVLGLIEAKDQAAQVIGLMDQMGNPCQQILLDWAYYGYSMDEIASRSKLSGAESARSMKYKCLKKLKKLIADKLDINV